MSSVNAHRCALLVLVFADLVSSWSAMQAMSIYFSPARGLANAPSLQSDTSHAKCGLLSHLSRSISEPQTSCFELPLRPRRRGTALVLRSQAGIDLSSSDSSESVRYRPGRPDDGPGLVELSMEAFQGGGMIENLITTVELALQGTDLRTEVEGGLARRMMMLPVEGGDEEEALQSDNASKYALFVAEDKQSGKMVGMVELGILPCPALETPYLVNLAVARERRREGIARALIAQCERIAAEEWGFREMFLHVKANNRPARRLYGSMGFVCEFQEPMWYRLKSGQQKLRRNPRLFLRKVFPSQPEPEGAGGEPLREGGGSQTEGGKRKAYVWGSEP